MAELDYWSLRYALREEYAVKDGGVDLAQESVTDRHGKTRTQYVLTVKLRSGAALRAEGFTCRQVYDRLPDWVKRPVEG